MCQSHELELQLLVRFTANTAFTGARLPVAGDIILPIRNGCPDGLALVVYGRLSTAFASSNSFRYRTKIRNKINHWSLGLAPRSGQRASVRD